MSNEFDNEIKEDVLLDKIFNFFNSYKIYISVVIFLLIFIPISYQVKILFDKQKNEQELEKLSNLIINFDGKKPKDLELIKKLLISKNEIVSSLALNKLLDINTISNKEKIILLDNLLTNKALSEEITQNLKIKKALLVFDNIEENDLLNLLNSKNENYKDINLRLISDFYLSKKQYLKAKDLEKSLNEN